MARQLASSDIWDVNVTKYGFQSKEGMYCATAVVITFILCVTAAVIF